MKHEWQVGPEILDLLAVVRVEFNVEERFFSIPCCQNTSGDNTSSRLRAKRHGRGERDSGDFPNAGRVLYEALLVVKPSQEIQVNPHGLLRSGIANVDEQRVGQVGRPV